MPGLRGLGQIESSPITGIHLWFDRPVCPLDHAVTVGRLDPVGVQPHGPPGPRAAREAASTSSWSSAPPTNLLPHGQGADPRRRARRNSASHLAGGPRGGPETLVGRHRARGRPSPFGRASTPRGPPSGRPIDGPVPGRRLDRHRLARHDGGSACASGYLAAEGILSDLGRPERLVKPDLPSTWLSRPLLGRPGLNRPKASPAPSATPLATNSTRINPTKY